MATEPAPARRHFTTIDGLRGIAALSVCLFHLGGAGLPKLASPLTASLTSWGWTGVQAFFVISGFVIPYVMLRGDYHWRNAGNFLARRFVRVWPPSAILIGLTCALFAVLNFAGRGDPAGWTALSIERVIANLAYAVPFTDQSWLNGVLWTLCVEFQYYLLLALILPLLRGHPVWLIATGALSLVSVFLPFAQTAKFFVCAIYFAMGGVVLLYREHRLPQLPTIALLALMGIVAALELGWLQSAVGVGTGLIIAFVPLRSRILTFLGTISYSLYLVHMLFASTTEFLVIRLIDPTSPVQRIIAQLICLAAAIGGAWLFYLIVERRFVNLSQGLASRATPAVNELRSASL
jgi:peptidoglycan/LPS O-acetylase OafA/YrhL